MKIIANPNDIAERITELIDNLKELEDAKNAGITRIDLCQAGFITPLSILPLVSYAVDNGINITYSESNTDIQRYLDMIGFPDGATALQKTDKNFLPLMRLPILDNGDDILEGYENKILELNPNKSVSLTNNLKYLTGELQTNIKEHSKTDKYWLFAQYYNSRNTCEIVIADNGIGYRQSYDNCMFKVGTDAEAILNALGGKSSKPKLYGMTQRGTGIRSIGNMFVKDDEGYCGNLVMMSGNSIVYYTHNEIPILLPLKSSWKGSLVAINFYIKPVSLHKFIKI